MIVFGITGPTGSGKTTVLNAFADQDIEIIDCDKLYHQMLQEDSRFRFEIASAFPNVVLDDGSIDRRKLAREVFNDEAKLIKLNWIVFPAVSREVQKRIQQCGKIGIAIDAINLFESGINVLCNYTIGVVAPKEIRHHRIMKRDNISSQDAWSRINAQKDEDWYRKRCNYLIENNFSDKRTADIQIDRIVSEIVFYVYSTSPRRNHKTSAEEQILHNMISSAKHNYRVKLEKWASVCQDVSQNKTSEVEKDYIRSDGYFQACRDIAQALFHWTEEDIQSIHDDI